MRLLSHSLPSARRLLPSADGWFTLGVAGALVGLELYGRHASSDWHDALAAVGLLFVTLSVAVRHRRSPLGWVGRLGRAARRVGGVGEWAKHNLGVDFRGDPPLPRRVPPAVAAVFLGLGLWAAATTAAWVAFPGGWREAGVRSVYVAYLVAVLALWVGLLACLLAGMWLPVLVCERLFQVGRREDVMSVLLGYTMLLVLVAWLVPPAVALGLCLLITAGAGVAFARPGGDAASLVWRSGPGQPLYAVPAHRLVAALVGLGAGVVFNLLLAALGGRVFGQPQPPDGMPLTYYLGLMTAYAVPGLAALVVVRLWHLRRTDPARRTPPAAHVAGLLSAAARASLSRVFARWGWRWAAAPLPAGAIGVRVEVVPAERSEATEFDPRWPLKVSVADLESDGVRPRLERRDEIQLRRQFFRGLEKLFKRATILRGSGGGGLWVAPHWWFIDGVAREEGDRDRGDDGAPVGPVGPPYRRLFDRRVRQHFHRVLRAVQVDMVFVEDGVSFKKFEKVMRAALELYDVHGGNRRAEDHHFRGVPKVRVMIHEYAPGNPFQAGGYPEPTFDELSRVRVLHVFRDRGDHEELAENPFDVSWEPAPLGAN